MLARDVGHSYPTVRLDRRAVMQRSLHVRIGVTVATFREMYRAGRRTTGELVPVPGDPAVDGPGQPPYRRVQQEPAQWFPGAGRLAQQVPDGHRTGAAPPVRADPLHRLDAPLPRQAHFAEVEPLPRDHPRPGRDPALDEPGDRATEAAVTVENQYGSGHRPIIAPVRTPPLWLRSPASHRPPAGECELHPPR